jgi:uncharacterized membrane protein
MTDLIAIGYPDETTADAAAYEAERLAMDLQVRGMLKPATSALFLMVSRFTPDKAVEAMSKSRGTVLKTSLSEDDERELQHALHGSETAAEQPA